MHWTKLSIDETTGSIFVSRRVTTKWSDGSAIQHVTVPRIF